MIQTSASKHIDIIGFPMDLGADHRGVDMGPSALRIAGIQNKLINLGYTVSDLGDIPIRNQEIQQIKNPKLKYLDEIVKRTEILAKKVEKSLSHNHFPLCLGGDHSMAIGTISGISAFCNKKNIELGLIWIDAHADLNTEKTTPSGNIHGMSVAASLGYGNKKLTSLYGFSPKIKPENVVMIGLRSVDPGERELIKKLKLKVYTMTEIDRKGIGFFNR